MKKVINLLFLFSLMIGVCFGISQSKPIYARIDQPPTSNPIDYSRTEYNNDISEYSLFNNYDYSFLESIDVDVHLTSTNVISTSLSPTSNTNYSEYCFGNLCYNQTIYILYGSVYSQTRNDTAHGTSIVNIYTSQGDEGTNKTLTYNNTTCNTTTYYNNSIMSVVRDIYFVFTSQSDMNQLKGVFEIGYSNSEDMIIATKSTLQEGISYIENTYNTKILYDVNTGLSDTNTLRTSTCTAISTNNCTSTYNNTYEIYLYNQYLGTFNFSKGLTFDANQNKCVIQTIGTSLNNGYYNSYTLNYNSLTLSEKQQIWNKLTQQNQTSTFDYYTLYINGTNNYIIGGMNFNFYLKLNFKGNINYEYNNMYIKFNTNSTATLKYIYYGIFDLSINYSTNNTYTNFLLNENSRINSNYLVLQSEIETSGIINYYMDYNFNISLLTDVLIDQIMSVYNYDDCKWYQFMCHLGNAFTKIIYNVPILSDFYVIFDNIRNTTMNILNLFTEYQGIAFLSSVLVASLLYHFIKRSVE